MKTQLRDPDTGLSFTYEQEDGISLFRHPRTGEVRQDKAGARPPGMEWQQIANVHASRPVAVPERPAEVAPATLTLSQRLAKELPLAFSGGLQAVLLEMAHKIEQLESR